MSFENYSEKPEKNRFENMTKEEIEEELKKIKEESDKKTEWTFTD